MENRTLQTGRLLCLSVMLSAGLLSACHPLQGGTSAEREAYDQNFEIIGEEKDRLTGEVNPEIFHIADRANKGLRPVRMVISSRDGKEISLPSGRYHLSGSASGNIHIYDKNKNLIMRETIGNAAYVGAFVADIDESYTIFYDGGYTTMSIRPIETELKDTLLAGIHHVGTDIEPGSYIFVPAVYGLGYLHVYDKEAETQVFELVGAGYATSEVAVDLKEGQVVRIRNIDKVHIIPADEYESYDPSDQKKKQSSF